MPQTLINLDYGTLTSTQADETIEDGHNSEFTKVDFVDFASYRAKET